MRVGFLTSSGNILSQFKINAHRFISPNIESFFFFSSICFFSERSGKKLCKKKVEHSGGSTTHKNDNCLLNQSRYPVTRALLLPLNFACHSPNQNLRCVGQSTQIHIEQQIPSREHRFSHYGLAGPCSCGCRGTDHLSRGGGIFLQLRKKRHRPAENPTDRMTVGKKKQTDTP